MASALPGLPEVDPSGAHPLRLDHLAETRWIQPPGLTVWNRRSEIDAWVRHLDSTPGFDPGTQPLRADARR